MAELRKTDYHDVRDVGVDDEKRERLFAAQTECSVAWTTRDNWPVAVLHRFVWHDGRFWITCTAERMRVKALRTRPKSCVVVSSEGTWLGGDVTTTAKTMARVHEDREVKDWFYPALARRQRPGEGPLIEAARAEFLRRIDTPTRVVVELDPVSWITYDGNKLEAALRGVPYDPLLAKGSRNITEPPTGVEMKRFEPSPEPDRTD